jgi:hypothetical protein
MSSFPTHILISFCNVLPGAPTLCLLDIATGSIRVLDVPEELSSQGGATGVAVSGEYLFVATSRTTGPAGPRGPRGPSSVFAFDRRNLALSAHHVCETVYDAHSMLPHDGDLIVVSTGTDAVVRLRLDGPRVRSEEVVWRPDPDGALSDVHHLNAVARWQDRVVVSGFGKKLGHTWASATNGFIHDLTHEERLAGSIRQPHALADVDGTLAYCESGEAAVVFHGDVRRRQFDGYTRGMCTAGGSLFVATSKGRRTSKSSGRLTNRGDPGTPEGRCTLFRVRPTDLAIEAATDLGPYGWEVYDVVPLSDISRWPVAADTKWRDRMIAGLKESSDDRESTVSWLHVEVARRDKDLVWLHREVAQRDAEIERLNGEVARRENDLVWLHREVAQRDAEIERLNGELARRDNDLVWLHREVAERDRLVDELRTGLRDRQ